MAAVLPASFGAPCTLTLSSWQRPHKMFVCACADKHPEGTHCIGPPPLPRAGAHGCFLGTRPPRCQPITCCSIHKWLFSGAWGPGAGAWLWEWFSPIQLHKSPTQENDGEMDVFLSGTCVGTNQDGAGKLHACDAAE